MKYSSLLQGKQFVRKEFLHIFRDSRTMLILLVMPLVLICLFGFAITTEVKNGRVIVVDEVNSKQSRGLIQAIDANTYFDVVCVKSITPNQEGVESTLKSGAADAIIILDKQRGIQILADGSEPNQAQTRISYLQQIIRQQKAPTANAGTETQVSIKMLFNPQLKSEYNFVPAIIGMVIMLICAMMTSISIVREKEMGTMEVLLASPLHPLVIILSKLTPYFVVSSINVINILLLSHYVLNIPLVGGFESIASFLLISMVYIFVSLALGLFISTIVNSQLAAMLLSLLLIVPTVYLSGMVFPLESMPVPFQNVSRIVPARWYMGAARRLLIQGVEFRYIAKELAILCVEAVVLVTVSLKMYKTRLD